MLQADMLPRLSWGHIIDFVFLEPIIWVNLNRKYK